MRHQTALIAALLLISVPGCAQSPAADQPAHLPGVPDGLARETRFADAALDSDGLPDLPPEDVASDTPIGRIDGSPTTPDATSGDTTISLDSLVGDVAYDLAPDALSDAHWLDAADDAQGLADTALPDIPEPQVCGDATCDSDESCATCPLDCSSCCDQTGCPADADCPTCPLAPPECPQTGGFGAPQKGVVVPVASDGFMLHDNGAWQASYNLIDQIGEHSSVVPVTLDMVLQDLNRVATKVTGVPGTDCFHTGFKWNSGDNSVKYWYPQGITGTGDAFESGAYSGRKVGLASWYHKPDNDSAGSPNKGVRLAIYDVTDMDSVKYRWALLVEPIAKDGVATYKAVTVHAGGIVWYGNTLYVADTTQGFRVFDMTRILDVPAGDKSDIGLVAEADSYYAHNYSYVIPQVARYQLCNASCSARFSFVSLDRSTTPHTLVAGEYSAGNTLGRLHRWALDPETGRLLTTNGYATSTQAVYPGVSNIQGALSHAGRFYMSTSGSGLGLYHGKLGEQVQKRGWPYGPEDLHYAPASGNLWSLTEHPNQRYVFAVKLAKIAGIGCTPAW
jgi:hypothetical protein